MPTFAVLTTGIFEVEQKAPRLNPVALITPAPQVLTPELIPSARYSPFTLQCESNAYSMPPPPAQPVSVLEAVVLTVTRVVFTTPVVILAVAPPPSRKNMTWPSVAPIRTV